MLRREWRQQALVLGLLTLAVGACVGFGAALHNISDRSVSASFGNASYRAEIDIGSASDLVTLAQLAGERFGVVESVASWSRPVPGSVEEVRYVSQDPSGPLAARTALVNGRYPTSVGEVAITDGVAAMLDLSIGDHLALDERDRTITGIVETPDDLDAEYAMVSPADRELVEQVTLLLGQEGRTPAEEDVRAFLAEHGGADAKVEARPDDGRTDTAIAVLGATAVVLMLVALITAAGFIAVAERRRRQFGLLGVLGATQRQLRVVLLAHGVAVGALAAVAGAVLGLVGWVAVAPRLEGSAGHRIDAGDVPWWLVVAAMILVVVAATAAAWWPAHHAARLPLAQALADRPPARRASATHAGMAVVLLATGFVTMLLGRRATPLLVVVGTVLVVGGVLALTPVSLRLLARSAALLPPTARLAVRDLARYGGRSAAVLAALTVAVGIPLGIVVSAAAAEASRPQPNITAEQFILWTRDSAAPEGVSPWFTDDPDDEGFSPYLPRIDEAALVELGEQVRALATSLDGAETHELSLVTDSAAAATSDGRLAVTVAQETDSGLLDIAPVFLATPRLLELYHVDADLSSGWLSVPPADRLPDQLRSQLTSDELYLANLAGPPTPAPEIQRLDPGPTSLPGTLVTEAEAARLGWQPVVGGWLVEREQAFTASELRVTRERATELGLLVESHQASADLTSLRWGATGAGLLVAAGVLGTSLGLLRHEAASRDRILSAAGATSRQRKALNATTAGALCLLAVALGTAAAYLTIAGGFAAKPSTLADVPYVELVCLWLGLPLAAGLAAWLSRADGGRPVG